MAKRGPKPKRPEKRGRPKKRAKPKNPLHFAETFERKETRGRSKKGAAPIMLLEDEDRFALALMFWLKSCGMRTGKAFMLMSTIHERKRLPDSVTATTDGKISLKYQAVQTPDGKLRWRSNSASLQSDRRRLCAKLARLETMTLEEGNWLAQSTLNLMLCTKGTSEEIRKVGYRGLGVLGWPLDIIPYAAPEDSIAPKIEEAQREIKK